MRKTQRKIICDEDDARNLVAALKVAMDRFRQEDALAMERGMLLAASVESSFFESGWC